MPSSRFTLDSNILFYAADHNAGEPQASAIEIVTRASQHDCVLTPQALAESFYATTRKRIVPRAEAARQVRNWTTLFPITQGAEEVALRTALDAAVAGQRQFYDALLLATARGAGCCVVISDDMGEHARFDSVRVVAPFDERGGISRAALAVLESDATR